MEPEDVPGKNPAESKPPTIEDLKDICRRLNDVEVKYILIGGFAVNYYGLTRGTQDIDFLVDPAEENIRKISRALSFLPDKASLELQPNDVEQYEVVRIADEIIIDLIGKVGDLNYGNAGTETCSLEGIKIPVGDIDTMIRSKQGIREKDKQDLQFLLMKKEELEKRDLSSKRTRNKPYNR